MRWPIPLTGEWATTIMNTEYEIHPAAEYFGFPMLSGDDLDLLVANIKEYGQLEPLVILDGKILDGRNRYIACKKLGTTPRTELYTGMQDPYDFVWSKNFHRRHLTGSQKALAAAKRATLTRDDFRGNQYQKVDRLPSSLSKTNAQVAAEAKVARSEVIAARRVMRESPEATKAVADGKISIKAAEQVVKLPKEQQAAALEAAIKRGFKKGFAKSGKTNNDKPTPGPDGIEVKTGKPAKREDHIPEVLTKGIITNDLLIAGYATSVDMHGEPNGLPIGVSKLQRDDEVKHSIGGSNTIEHRKDYYKWQQYQKAHIRTKVLKILEAMNPVEVPKLEKKAGFIYQYNLGVACDLRELADMLCADLHRQADMLEIREKYGHLI